MLAPNIRLVKQGFQAALLKKINRHELARKYLAVAVGGILVYIGFLNFGVSRWLRHGKQWAFAMSAYGTLSLLVFLTLLVFIETPADPTDPFAGSGSTTRHSLLIHGSYFVLVILVWGFLRRHGSEKALDGGAEK